MTILVGAQDFLQVRAVWSESLQDTLWVAKEP